MRSKTAIAAAAAVLLASVGAHAQLAASPMPGPLSAAPPVAGSGIPLGAVELGTTGLSPPPAAVASDPGLASPSLGPMTLGGSTVVGPSMPSALGTGLGTGSGGSLGSGLSATPLPPPAYVTNPGAVSMVPGVAN